MSANELSLLETGIEHWNQWRRLHPHHPIDLTEQDLSHGYFFEGNLRGANLQGANLQRACLIGADLQGADLQGADLQGAYLGDANLRGANLSQANLKDANLDRANLQRTNLLGTNIIKADIRTAQLPDPNVDPYMDEVISLLAKARLESVSSNSAASRSPNPTKPNAYNTAKYRQSLLQQMLAGSPALTKESARAAKTRQQAIRQSAVIVSPSRKTIPIHPARRQSDRQLSSKITRAVKSLANLAKSIVF